jgi:hypothetical protein
MVKRVAWEVREESTLMFVEFRVPVPHSSHSLQRCLNSLAFRLIRIVHNERNIAIAFFHRNVLES